MEQTPIHVCSLSTSHLTKIKQQIDGFSTSKDKRLKYRLQWLNVSMEYNRQCQIQNIFQHLGSKANHPRFRVVKMKPFWHQWKKEILRYSWAEFREKVDQRSIETTLTQKQTHFSNQRIELASRAFLKHVSITNPPIKDLLNQKDSSTLTNFQIPASNRPGFFNLGYNYCESEAVRTFSDFPDSETEDEKMEPWERPLVPQDRNEMDNEEPVIKPRALPVEEVKAKPSPAPVKPVEKTVAKQEQGVISVPAKSSNTVFIIIGAVGLLLTILIWIFLRK